MPFIAGLTSDLGEQIVSVFLAVAEPATIHDGAELFVEGQFEPNLGVVLLSGTVSIEKSYGPPSTEQGPVLLGEVKQFDPKQERTATVRARGTLEVLRFRWDELNAEVGRLVSDEELKEFRKSLLEHAWKHNLS